jgi:hypothetical protein
MNLFFFLSPFSSLLNVDPLFLLFYFLLSKPFVFDSPSPPAPFSPHFITFILLHFPFLSPYSPALNSHCSIYLLTFSHPLHTSSCAVSNLSALFWICLFPAFFLCRILFSSAPSPHFPFFSSIPFLFFLFSKFFSFLIIVFLLVILLVLLLLPLCLKSARLLTQGLKCRPICNLSRISDYKNIAEGCTGWVRLRLTIE